MTLSGKVVLIVEDEADLREAMVYDFKRKGFQTLSASNGKDAFEIVKKGNVDLVITDVRMPIEDGIQLLKKIKKQDSDSPPVILISGYMDITVEEAHAAGADAIFSKPFDRKELFAKVAQVLKTKVSST